MGTLGEGNSGDRPPEHGGPHEGLPGLPPEWGTVVIPDDLSELAEEAASVRRELRWQVRRTRWRRRVGLSRRGESSIGLPLLIMAIAVVATLTSLFAVAWPKPHRNGPAPAGAVQTAPSTVPDVALTDAAGTNVRLRDTVPAVLLLVDGCDCTTLIKDTSRAAGSGVNVLLVSRSAATEQPERVRPLADPADTLRGALRLPPPGGTASVVLVARTGKLAKVVTSTQSLDDYRTQLAALQA